MTSTNMFQGLEDGGKPSSRVLRPPGGGSSNIFGGHEDDAGASSRPNKMASKIFAPPEEPKESPKRTNPPGGKSSGIFTKPEAASPQHKSLPSGGVTNNIFGGSESNLPTVKSHPNKPKGNISLGSAVVVEEPAPPPKAPEVVKKEVVVSPRAVSIKEAPEPTASQGAESSPGQPAEKDHEPRLGPRPRSHNRVLNPPGGKSSVVFY